jgi:hypothetical protein
MPLTCQKAWVFNSAVGYTVVLWATQLCCGLHSCAVGYTAVLWATQLCCGLHDCAVGYTAVLWATQLCYRLHNWRNVMTLWQYFCCLPVCPHLLWRPQPHILLIPRALCMGVEWQGMCSWPLNFIQCQRLECEEIYSYSVLSLHVMVLS